MFYDKTLTIPANTLEAGVVSEKLVCTHGVVHRVEVEFPKGCSGLAYFRVKVSEHQIWPTNPGEWFRSDDHAIGFNEYFQFYDSPYELKLEGYNLDDSYSHSITLRVGILPRSVAEYVYGKPSQREQDRLREAFGLGEGG